MKVVKLSALRTGRLYPQGNIPGTHFYDRLSQLQGHSAVGSIMSIKNFSDNIENRTRDLPVCSAMPQPTAPPRAPIKPFNNINYHFQMTHVLVVVDRHVGLQYNNISILPACSSEPKLKYIHIFQEVQASRISKTSVNLSALRTGRLYLPKDIAGTDLC
jgi:hypothetical protein